MSTDTAQDLRLLSLAQLACELRERADRAFDVEDRYTGETDADLCAVLGYLVDFADRFVFARCTDFDHAALHPLSSASEAASKAWSYLRSGAPALQRTLRAPSAEDLAFFHERLRVQHRSNSPYCRVDRGDQPRRLEYLYVPGRPSLTLDMLLFKCASLAHARRVLTGIGLEPHAAPDGNREALAVAGEAVVLHR